MPSGGSPNPGTAASAAAAAAAASGATKGATRHFFFSAKNKRRTLPSDPMNKKKTDFAFFFDCILLIFLFNQL